MVDMALELTDHVVFCSFTLLCGCQKSVNYEGGVPLFPMCRYEVVHSILGIEGRTQRRKVDGLNSEDPAEEVNC